MPRLSQSRVVSTVPSTRSRSGTGSIPHNGVSLTVFAPFAGTSQIRFDGCDLSAARQRTPASVP